MLWTSLGYVARSPRVNILSRPLVLQQRLRHVLSALPDDWKKLKVPVLEVMDTTELDSLAELSAKERERLTELRDVAKAQQRKVLRVNCDLDIKAVDRLHGFIDHVKRDKRRSW